MNYRQLKEEMEDAAAEFKKKAAEKAKKRMEMDPNKNVERIERQEPRTKTDIALNK